MGKMAREDGEIELSLMEIFNFVEGYREICQLIGE